MGEPWLPPVQQIFTSSVKCPKAVSDDPPPVPPECPPNTGTIINKALWPPDICLDVPVSDPLLEFERSRSCVILDLIKSRALQQLAGVCPLLTLTPKARLPLFLPSLFPAAAETYSLPAVDMCMRMCMYTQRCDRRQLWGSYDMIKPMSHASA